MYIDTHAHLTDECFQNCVDEILEQSKQQGVEKIFCASYDKQSSIESVELAKKYDDVYAIIGVHPHDAKTYDNELEKTLTQLAQFEKVVAIGEIGLDYHYDLSPRDVQKQVFEKQIELAHKLQLPIVIHTREAIGDTMEILRRYKSKICGALVHCFNASKEILHEIMDMGFYVSYGGAVTFKNANGLLEAVKNTPLDRIMLETDCPYMTPVPYRGKTNFPKYIPIVAQKISELKNVPIKEVEEITTKNAKKFFKID